MIRTLFLPSISCLVAALLLFSRQLQGRLTPSSEEKEEPCEPRGKAVFFIGLASLIFVPIFKVMTGLPPFMGILFSMSIMWLITDMLHHRHEDRQHLRVASILPRIDLSGILFFLGILLSVSALHAAGILGAFASFLDSILAYKEVVAIAIGFISAVVDNVPLVAACMGMYDIALYPADSPFWQLVAYCAGTGGSLLIIGSAAGVAFMGIEKVDFFWYVRRAALPALVGYVVGIAVYALSTFVV